jgi:hypothetical protein
MRGSFQEEPDLTSNKVLSRVVSVKPCWQLRRHHSSCCFLAVFGSRKVELFEQGMQANKQPTFCSTPT